MTLTFESCIKPCQLLENHLCYVWYDSQCFLVFCFVFRAMTSVSWVHQRRRMLTGCSVVSWELFMYSAKLSTQLRSLLFTNLARDIRWDSATILPALLYILCVLYSESMPCTAWQREYSGKPSISLSMLLNAVCPCSRRQLEVVEAINHSWAVSRKYSLYISARVSLWLVGFCCQFMCIFWILWILYSTLKHEFYFFVYTFQNAILFFRYFTI